MSNENQRAIGVLLKGNDVERKPRIRPPGGTQYLFEAESQKTVEGNYLLNYLKTIALKASLFLCLFYLKHV